MENLIEILTTKPINIDSENIYFRRGEFTLYDIDFALKRIYDLHLRSLGQQPIIIDIDSSLTRYEARRLYSVAIAGLNTTLLNFSDNELFEVLDKILDFIYELQSNQAFESVFLTAISCIDNLDSNLAEYYYSKFSNFGFPQELGGGFSTSYFINNKENIIGFTKSIEEHFKSSKLVKKSYANLKERLLLEKAQDMEILGAGTMIIGGCLTGAFYGAVAGSVVPGVGTFNGAVGGCVIGGVSGIILTIEKGTADEKKNKEDEENGKNENPTPEPPTDPCEADGTCSTDKNTNGCIIDPNWIMDKVDPYRKFSPLQRQTVIAYGKGLEKLTMKNEKNVYSISNLPKLEISKKGLIEISKLGILNLNIDFKIAIEKNQVEKKLNFGLINKNNHLGKDNDIIDKLKDFTKLPLINDPKSSLYSASQQTKAYTDNEGNVVTENINIVTFNHPYLIAKYGNSQNMTDAQLKAFEEYMKLSVKFLNSVDYPKEALGKGINIH